MFITAIFAFTNSDYEFLRAFDSYPIEGKPISQEQAATHSIAPVVWDEMTASSAIIQEIAAAKPAGLVFAMNLNRAATAGLYTFRCPSSTTFLPSTRIEPMAMPSLKVHWGTRPRILGGESARFCIELRIIEIKPSLSGSVSDILGSSSCAIFP